jgi:hypothetical protein
MKVMHHLALVSGLQENTRLHAFCYFETKEASGFLWSTHEAMLKNPLNLSCLRSPVCNISAQ